MKRSASGLILAIIAVLSLAGMTIYIAAQETPTGRLRGKVLAEETGRPLPGAEVQLHLTSNPSEKGSNFVLHTKADGAFSFTRLPVGSYTLSASSEAHTLRPTRIEVEEGKLKEMVLELSPIPPFFDLRVHQHVFTPEEAPEVVVHGFLPNDVVAFNFYRVDPQALFKSGNANLRGILYFREQPKALMLEDNPALALAQTSSVQITQRDAEGVFHQRFSLPKLKPGIYVVAAQADALKELSWLMITQLGLITKRWGDGALAYVTDIKTGKPVAGARVEFLPEEGLPISGLTDAQGLFQSKLPQTEGGANLLARAEFEGSQAFLTSWMWNEAGEGDVRVYLYCDRPVYRPGHEIHFKGILRRYAEAGYSVLAGKSVEVKVYDPRDTLVYRGQFVSNDYGSYHGNFSISTEAATGYYRIVSTVDGHEHESGMKVAEYRKPEYLVEVTTAKKRYVRGETLEARVSAQYYFGAPVVGAEVHYLVRRAPYYFYPGEEEYDYAAEGEYEGDYSYGEVIEEGDAKTDETGALTLRVSTKQKSEEQADEEEAWGPQDSLYVVEVTVTDPSRKSVSANGSAIVTQGQFALFLEPTNYIAAPGETAEIKVQAKDYDGKPVKDARIKLSAALTNWLKDEVKYEEQAKGEVTTDAEGKASFSFKPQIAGSYRIQGRSRDAMGNNIFATSYLWVTREDYTDFNLPYPQLEMVTDKKSYRPGENVVLLINSKTKGATALLTVEGDRVYEHRLVQLQGNSTRVEIPIKPYYEPNFFIAVAFVKDKDFYNTEKRVAVSAAEHRLQVEVKADKARYQPGEKATFQMQVKDWKGKPVKAELSLGVVDESIYAIQEETAPKMLSFFYPARWNKVYTEYSFPQLYLDADKDAVGIKVRKKFPDTAYWNPTIVTDAKGSASVSFTMPDTLTTWRATVRAATLATQVGEATAKVITTKDLIVRLETPRFFVQTDRLTLSAIAHNYSQKSQSLKVWLKAPKLNFLRGKPEQQTQFTLAPEGIRRTDWLIEVPATGEQEITVYAKATSGLSDAMALTIPALPHGRERVEWRSGAVTQAAQERLIQRADAIPGATSLRVRLSPSIASVLLGALDYLASYPYGCTEQTMSAFLPDVVVARALRELKLPNPKLEKELPQMVQKGFDRLYNFQHDDGGWGWWEYDNSDPWMTAYVVFGLITAKENGFSVNEAALDQGLSWLARQVQQTPNAPLTSERAYVLYVLSLAGKGNLADQQLMRAYRNLNSLSSYELALVTLALEASGKSAEARIATERLWQQAKESQALVSWAGMSPDWGKSGVVETTALAFKALFALDPNDPRLFKATRWLVLNREGNHWVSTRDTAFVLYALTDFLKHSQELQPDYAATLKLNGQPLLQRKFGRADLFNPEVEVKVEAKDLRPGDNLLTFEKQGPGNLYYTAIFRQVVGQEQLPKLITGAGISVQRNYYRILNEKNPRRGIITTSPAPNPTTEFRSGEPIFVRLTINTPQPCEYIVIEDPLPAGCEVAERGDLEPWEWDRWWSQMEVRDEKVAFFARRLPAGTSTIEYHLTPQIPGEYHALPTDVYSMYNPEIRGSGAETIVKLK